MSSIFEFSNLIQIECDYCIKKKFLPTFPFHTIILSLFNMIIRSNRILISRPYNIREVIMIVKPCNINHVFASKWREYSFARATKHIN